MNEYLQGFQGTIGLAIVLVYSVLWWIGGRPGGRIWRRWIAPLFFSISLCLYALWLGVFKLIYLSSIPAYLGVSYIGYGGKSLKEKFIRRFVWSLVYSLASLTFVLWSGKWLIWLVQLITSQIFSLVFGIYNPFESAPKEEGIICFGSSFLVPSML